MAPRTEIYPYNSQFIARKPMAETRSSHNVAFQVGDQTGHQMNSGRRGQPFRDYTEYVAENRSAEYEQRDDYHHFDAMVGTDAGGDQVGAPALPAAGAAGHGAAMAAFNKRHNKAHRFLCETQEDVRLRDLLRTIPPGIVGGLGRARRAWMALIAQCTLLNPLLMMKSKTSELNGTRPASGQQLDLVRDP